MTKGASTNLFGYQSNATIVGPHIIATSCDISVTIDDAGMSEDQQFDAAEFFEWLYCEGGSLIPLWDQNQP